MSPRKVRLVSSFFFSFAILLVDDDELCTGDKKKRKSFNALEIIPVSSPTNFYMTGIEDWAL
jgi:hypothetical protein